MILSAVELLQRRRRGARDVRRGEPRAPVARGGRCDAARRRSYAVDFGANRIVQPEIRSNADFHRRAHATSFAIEFRSRPIGGRSTRRGTAGTLDVIEDELPFGVSTFRAEAVCETSLRIAGWALASGGHVRRVGSNAPDGRGSGRRRAGTRPTCRPIRHPGSRPAGWEFAAVHARADFTLRVVVEDTGTDARIGETRIRADRNDP